MFLPQTSEKSMFSMDMNSFGDRKLALIRLRKGLCDPSNLPDLRPVRPPSLGGSVVETPGLGVRGQRPQPGLLLPFHVAFPRMSGG